MPQLNGTPRRLVVALTGGIGSGKSAFADLLHELGAGLVDTDVIARQLTAPGGGAIPALREAFGDALIMPEGALDRAAMRKRVFADPAEKARLEGILHPMIRAEVDRQLERVGGAYVVLVVPLLVESGFYRNRVQRIVVVDCPEALQVQRVMARDRFSEPEVRAIMARQASRQARLAVADDVVDNSGNYAQLRAAAEALHARYLELARALNG